MSSRPSKIFSTLAILQILLGYADAMAADSAPFCEERLQELTKSTSSPDELISSWEALESRCGDNGFYEYHLSKLLISSGHYAKAKNTIASGLELNSPYDKELMLASGDIFLHQKQYANAESEYKAVVEKYPDWYLAYNYLGFALFAQGDNAQAIEQLNQANSLQEDSDSYRTLTLAYYLIGDHEESVESLNRAFSLDESILGDRDPMVAGIRSYADLGKFEISRKLLVMLLERRPELRSDQEYLRAGMYLRAKMIEAGRVAN